MLHFIYSWYVWNMMDTPVYIKTHNSQKQAIKLRNSKASNYNIVLKHRKG